jgi:plastocyanin
VTISVGQSVTFVNNDSRSHEIASNPHPVHTDCPSTNALGTLSAGQTKLTNAYTVARSCGFHDHLNPDNAALQGNIVIQ